MKQFRTVTRGQQYRPRAPGPAAHRRMRWHEVLDRTPAGERVTMAEVGVWKGSLCKVLLADRPRLSMYLVDPWQAGVPGTSWWDSSSRMPRLPQEDYERSYNRVRRIAARAAGRATILRMPSAEGARQVPDGSLHMAFLDGDHSEDGLAADIEAWLPKVAAGGWIGGHDYGHERFPGVALAVRRYFTDAEVELGADDTWFVRR